MSLRNEPNCRGKGFSFSGLRGRWLLGCDGLHSTVRRQLGLDAGPRGSRTGVRQHFRVRPWTDLVEVHWAARGEAYVTPVGDRSVGIAVLSRHRGGFTERLEEFPALRARLADADFGTAS